MKVHIRYRNVSVAPLRFVAYLYTKGRDGQPVHDKVPYGIQDSEPCEPARIRELLFDWSLQGHPSDYIWKPPPELYGKFQFRRFTVDGKGMIHQTIKTLITEGPDKGKYEVSVGDVMHGDFPEDQGGFG